MAAVFDAVLITFDGSRDLALAFVFDSVHTCVHGDLHIVIALVFDSVHPSFDGGRWQDQLTLVLLDCIGF